MSSGAARSRRCRLPAAAGIILSAGLHLPAAAQAVFNEVEPNDSKATATGPLILAPGDSIAGVSTGSSTTLGGDVSADYFLIQTVAQPLGIYRHRLVLSAQGHVGTIRGRTQTAGVINPASDVAIQTSLSGDPLAWVVQWYGFGRQEQLYYRVAGSAETTSPYSATLQSAAAPVIDLGAFAAGTITIDRPAGVTADTDFWVYDAAMNPIPGAGNDNPNILVRTFGPGVYHIAYTDFNFANDQPAAADDLRTNGPVLDFPLSAANSSPAALPGLGIRVSDAFQQVSVPAPKSGPFDVVWLRFTVTSAPPTLGGCCLPEYVCRLHTQAACLASGGSYRGDNSACADCPQIPDGSVAILASAVAAELADVYNRLTGTGLFPYIRVLDVMTATPTLADVAPFSAVLVWSNQALHSGAAMGNLLADYVDGGGGVVLTMFVLTTSQSDRFLGGRWDASYQIIPHRLGSISGGTMAMGNILIPDHPILENVNTFHGGTTSWRPTTLLLQPHGVKVAEWLDGQTLIAVSTTRPNRVDLGLYPASSDSNNGGWLGSTDGARLLANALRYAGGNVPPPCPADWNGDGVVNSQDISSFITAWLHSVNTGVVLADFNADGQVNSTDISAFITAWLAAAIGGC